MPTRKVNAYPESTSARSALGGVGIVFIIPSKSTWTRKAHTEAMDFLNHSK